MKRYIFLWLCCSFFYFGNWSAILARHIIGGEMTYECLGTTAGDPSSRTYRVTIIMYRDCAQDNAPVPGALFDSSPPVGLRTATTGTVSIYEGNSPTPFGPTIELPAPVIDPVIPNIGNPCLVVPPGLCVQRGVYVFDIDLPMSNEGYTITYSRCCRNPTITNISTPGEVGMTFFIEITPEAQTVCNNSPVYDEFPPIVLCANEPFILPMGATDQEGDSLVYSFCSPVLGGGNNTTDPLIPTGVAPDPDEPPGTITGVAFQTPAFTAQFPLGQDAQFVYNDSTGVLTGTPMLQGQFVVGICIDEYRGDILLSSTKREFQFNITSCARTVDAMIQDDSITPDGQFIVNICGPDNFMIINESTQEAFIDTYSWYLETPDGDSIFENSLNLVVEAADTGQYVGTLILNEFGNFVNCRDTADFIINVFPDLRADFEFTYDTCVAGPVTFTNLSTADDPEGIDTYSWNFQDGSSPVSTINPVHLYNIPGSFPVSLTIQDFNRCRNTAVIPVDYFPAPPVLLVAPSATLGCEPQDVVFINNSIPIDSSYNYEWDFGDGGMSNAQNPQYVYETAGIYDVYLAVTSPIGCFIDTTFDQFVEIRESPTADFFFDPTMPTNLQRDVNFTDASMEAIGWRYEIGDIYWTNQRNFAYTFRDTGLIDVTQYVVHPSGCVDSITKVIDVEPVITFHAPNAFTPNGDGLNDIFIPKAFLFGYRDYRLTVWNQWGQVVYSTNDPTEGWDGSFKGRDSPGGGYLWEAKIIGPRNKVEKHKGTVTLLR